MARITVNETGTNPLVLLSTSIGNTTQLEDGNIASANVLSVTCLQDITISASTGIYSYVDFCSKDTNKVTTPADNEISMNIVIDPTAYFGANVANSGASNKGIAYLSQNKVPVQFLVVWNYNVSEANIVGGNIANLSNVYYSSGTGYISALAPTAAPDAPVFVTPITIAVDGTMYTASSDSI
jgi:hypothetical protein